MKKYIDFNNERRMNAANHVEKDFFKLMINYLWKSNRKFKKKNQYEISK